MHQPALATIVLAVCCSVPLGPTPAMNKTQLIDSVVRETCLTRAEVERALDAVLRAIGEALIRGDDVRLPNFGTFTVSIRTVTEGRNPRTGKTIRISASKQVKFRPATALSDSLNVSEGTADWPSPQLCPPISESFGSQR